MMRLDEYTKDEWFSVCKRLSPGLTETEYNRMWEDFQMAKSKKELN